MRFVRPKDERIASHYFGGSIFMTNTPLARNNQVKLPLRRVCVVRKIGFSGGQPIPFEIERMTLGQVARAWFAPQRFRTSLERAGILPTRRLPRFYVDFVDV